jgi:hypothetical protein
MAFLRSETRLAGLDSVFFFCSFLTKSQVWSMPTLEHIRSEIEHMRRQIGRQQKEI